jgi:hypothetical protein
MPDTPPPPDSDPQIKQDVTGNQNQTIGQVLGGMVVYGQVIYNNPSVESNSSKAKPDASAIGPNPYKGLLAFQETDGDRFFGRDPQIKELWEKFRNLHEDESVTRLLTIYGPSGSGKSSLARAGLIPELARRPLPGRDRAQVAILIPGDHPIGALAMILARIATHDSAPVEKAEEFERVLMKTTEDRRYDGLRRIADALPEISISPLIVLVDQLEEVFTLCEDSAERDAFVGNLLCAAAERSKRVSAIVTIRSDFLGATQQHPHLNQLLSSQGFFVAAMGAERLREAIAKPAKNAGHLIDQITVNRMIKETEGREGALPLLQFALEKIWEELGKGKKPAKTLENIGGVGGALAEGAERIYKKLTPEEKEISRRVFTGLVQLGEGAKDTRRRTNLERVVSHRNSLEQVQKVIARFADPGARLITLSDNAGVKTVEVTHEALFEHWKQLRDWLDASRSDLRFQRRLDEAAMVWQENGRAEGSLWRSPDLELLQSFYKRAVIDMTQLQIEFLTASKQSSRWRKIKERATYSIVSAISAVGVLIASTFFQITDIEYTIAKKQNEYTFFVPKPEFIGDKRKDYVYDLLRLVLSEAYPNQKIEIKTRKINTNQGIRTNALNRDKIDFQNKNERIKIDIDSMMENTDRNALAQKIDFPITLGLLSHRLCLTIKKNSNEDISKIKNKDVFLKKIHVTQVKYWPDLSFLKNSNNIKLSETENYDQSVQQLLNNKANCFLRGVSEIFNEQKTLKEKYSKDFLVANNFFFQYYSPEFFYVAKGNDKLAERIKNGLINSLESGKLVCIYKHHFGEFIQKAKLKKISEISLDRVDIKRSKYYLDFTKNYEKIFEDIEHGKTKMTLSECNSLIDKLRNRS